MKRYLLDTSVYGVLVDEGERDYGVVNKIIDYAKRNNDYFVTTFIIAKELDAEELNERIKGIIQPVYYLTLSKTFPPLEVASAEEYQKVKKLAWNYIQKLKKKDADKVMNDAENYAWSSVAGVDAFITRNRRGILSEEYRSILRRSNKKMMLKFVRIMSPTEFYELLV